SPFRLVTGPFREGVEDRSWWGVAAGMDLDAATLIEDDLSAGVGASGGLDVTMVEHAGEDQHAGQQLDLVDAAWPTVLPDLDVERLVWVRKGRAEHRAWSSCCCLGGWRDMVRRTSPLAGSDTFGRIGIYRHSNALWPRRFRLTFELAYLAP